MKRLWWPCLWMVLAVAPKAWGCDTIEFTDVINQALSDTNNPASVQMGVRKTGPICDFYITFSKGGAAVYERTLFNGGATSAYNLYSALDLSRILKEAADAVSGEFLTGSFTAAGDESKNVAFYVSHEAKKLKPPGVYTDQVIAKIFKGTLDPAATPMDTKPMSLMYVVPAVRELSLVDTGGAFDAADTSQSLEFGVLAESKLLGFDLLVRANSDYVVKMSSRNRGQLKHSHRDQFVSYGLRVDSALKDLRAGPESPVEVARGNGVTPETGNRHAVTVTIGSLERALSGAYSDFLTVIVEAN